MDGDRQSNLSSGYGQPKTSMDPLNPGSVNSRGERPRHDSSSSFFNSTVGRGSMAGVNPAYNTAGYNRDSFFALGREEPVKGGRDEEEGQEPWDVYADFNNAGPRYSTAFTSQPNPDGYHQLHNAPGTPVKEVDTAEHSTVAPVEMVTVPALGPEWKASELKGMRKSERSKEKREQRLRAIRSWWLDQRGGFCGGFLTRRTFVFALFGFLVTLAILLGIMIPRVPDLEFNGENPLKPPTDNSTNAQFARIPANFSFNANLDLLIDTHSNYLPLRFSHLSAEVFDTETSRKVGEGDAGKLTVPAKAFTQVLVPVKFNYTAVNDTDQTWMLWYNACKNPALYVDNKRPGLKFRLVLNMGIVGLIGRKGASTQISEAACPFQLPQNSV